MHVADRMTKIKSVGRFIAEGAASLFFPPICLGCRRIVAAGGTLCGNCWGEIHFLEEPWCAVSGVPFVMDIGEGAISPAVMASPPVYDRSRAAVAYDGAARRLAQSLKYQDRTDLAPWLGRLMARAGLDILADADMLVPVPLHRQRFLSRRYNQSAELARAVSRISGVAFIPDAAIRVRKTVPQVGLNSRQREDNVRAAFSVPARAAERVRGRHVCIVDDVYTTGATVAALAKCLRKAGAREISVLTFARVLPGDFRRARAAPI